MSSYISSFRAVFAALLMIVAAEVGYSTVESPSPVERSSYLNWNFNETELFHKALIYEKLRNAAAAKPDVIQVGDSSGFHGIIPSIVEKYIPGLRYENLSCCANTGFDGYYTIADFMLRHAPSIKAVVLYITWNSMVTPPTEVGAQLVGSPDRIRNAFGIFSPFTSPVTLAARESLLRSVYTLGHTFDQAASKRFDELWPDTISTVRAHQGWLSERDAHSIPARQARIPDRICPSSVADFGDITPRVPDIFGRQQSYTKIELARLARLIAQHRAKLVLIFQPHPCDISPNDRFFMERRADIAALVSEYPNIVVPAVPFEHWPGKWFTSLDHLRTGHEDALSRRVGRVVAAALNTAVVEPPKAPLPAQPVVVWSGGEWASPPWRYENIRLGRGPNGGMVASETATAGWHRLEVNLPNLAAGTYILSATYSTPSPRQLQLYLRDLQLPGAQGGVRCNTKDGDSFPNGGVQDWDIEKLPGDLFRCWGKLKLAKTGAVIGLFLARTANEAGPYQGDGTGNVVLHEVTLSSVGEGKQ